MTEELHLRIHGDPAPPTLIYLPGLHGDGTLIGVFRHALGERTHFVEVTYPRTLAWLLDDYAAAIVTALEQHGISRGWLLGESFGSQPLWAMVAHNPETHLSECDTHGFQIEGVILAGGFVKHPMCRVARAAERITRGMSNAWLVWIAFSYAKLARFRYRGSPEVLASIDEFIARRAEGRDRRAARHRLHLIAGNDPRDIARRTRLPVFGLSGMLDPVVPWPWVQRWLRKNCLSLRDYKILRSADHNVLSTAPREAAEQVRRWVYDL